MAVMSLSRWYHYNLILINLIIIFNNVNKQVMLQPYLNLGSFNIEFRDFNLFLSFFFLIATATLNKLEY